MLGEGARMIIMSIFYQGWRYSPNTFDMFFDWVPLVILGSIFFFEGIKSFHSEKVREMIQAEEVGFATVKKTQQNPFKPTKNPK